MRRSIACSEDDCPTSDDVAKLKYTEMVLAESMRLYPPAWALGRLAMEDFEIGGYVGAKKIAGADEPVCDAPRSALLPGAAEI